MMHPACAPRSDSGFSLMEVLIGLTLTAMIATLMMGSIATGARVWERGGQAQAASTRYVFTHRVGDWLARAMPTGVDLPSNPEHAPFSGAAAAVSFVVAGDGFGASPGLYRIDLRLAPDDACTGGASLSLTTALLSPGDGIEPLPEAPTTSRKLVDCMTGASFQFYGAQDDAPEDDPGPAWRTDWQAQTRLPLIVRLVANGDDGKPAAILTERLSLAESPPAEIGAGEPETPEEPPVQPDE